MAFIRPCLYVTVFGITGWREKKIIVLLPFMSSDDAVKST